MGFNTAEGQQDLYEYCNRPRRHILEVLYDFRHSTPNIPFEYLFDLIPPIKPRSFSIASPPGGTVLELLVAVVRYRSSLKAPRLGLCSNWLASMKPGSQVPVWVRRGAFTFPKEPTPVLMVGPSLAIKRTRCTCNIGWSSTPPCLPSWSWTRTPASTWPATARTCPLPSDKLWSLPSMVVLGRAREK